MSALQDTAEIEGLRVRERLDLTDRIWDTMPEEMPYEEFSPEEIPARHIELLEERLKSREVSPDAGRPWKEALGKIRARL